MPNLTDILREFNSKERFFLAGQVLGNPAFSLSGVFREKLGEKLGIPIPVDAFSAMDYHIDWLYASLNLARDNDPDKIYPNDDKVIKAQQEDMDWLVAFEAEGVNHLILIEAKGVTGWTNKQMTSKAIRFREVFGEESDRWPGVAPHFVIMSSGCPQELEVNKWPRWMVPNGKVIWVKLSIPETLHRVVRCDEKGHESIDGRFWKVENR